MELASFRSRFLSQLNNSFGSGGMSLAFNDAQFSSFIQYLKQESMGSLTIRKAVGIIGRQSDNVWVLGPDIQIDVDGNVIPPNERSHLWMDAIIHDGLCSVAPEEVLPVLLAPFRPDTSFFAYPGGRYKGSDSAQFLSITIDGRGICFGPALQYHSPKWGLSYCCCSRLQRNREIHCS